VVASMNYPHVVETIAEIESGIAFPLLVDVEGESQRVYGSATPVYPRNIVIGRDGKVVHEDNAGDLVAVESAIELALQVP